VQNDIELQAGHLHLIAGAKLEHHSDIGFAPQPSLRLLWLPEEQMSFWAAVSRAVRTPSRGETDGRLIIATIPTLEGQPPFFAIGEGNPDQEAEKLTAFEIGGRLRPTEWLFLDLATFVHFLKDGGDVELKAPVSMEEPYSDLMKLPLLMGNYTNGEIYGIEMSAGWHLRPNWRLQGSYTYLNAQLNLRELALISRSDPNHRLVLNSWMELTDDLQLDGTLRYTGDLADLGVDSYVEMDLRLGWQVGDRALFELVGRDLLHARHQEFQTGVIRYEPTQKQREVYVALSYGF